MFRIRFSHVILSAALTLAVILLLLPSLAHAVTRNRVGLQLASQVGNTTVAPTVCQVVLSHVEIAEADCRDPHVCYLLRVRANLAGQWARGTQRAPGDDALSAYQNGFAAWCNGATTEAVTLWSPFRAKFAQHWEKEGAGALTREDFDAAFGWFTLANALDPSPQASAGLGEVYRAQGNLDKALEAFDLAIARGTQDANIYRNAAVVAIQQKEYARAQLYCERALAFSDQDWRLWQLYGNALNGQEMWAQAEHAYRRVVQLNPTYSHGNAALGMVLARQGKFAEARPYFMNVIAYETSDLQKGGYLAVYASLLEKAGDHRGAVEFFKYASEFDPKNPSFAGSVVREFAAVGDCDGMTKWLAQRQEKGLPVPATVPNCPHD